jgi:hypothetical protein
MHKAKQASLAGFFMRGRILRMPDDKPNPSRKIKDEPVPLHGMTPEEAIRQMFGNRPTTTPAERDPDKEISGLASQIFLQVGSYQIPCRIAGCYSMGKVSAPKHQELTDEVKATLANHFYQHGWRYQDGPICPECAYRLDG